MTNHGVSIYLLDVQWNKSIKKENIKFMYFLPDIAWYDTINEENIILSHQIM